MTRRSIFRHSARASACAFALVVAVVGGGCESPSAVLHVTPTAGSPTVTVEACAVGTTTDCAMTQLFDGSSSASKSLALFDKNHDASLAVLFLVSGAPLGYCQEIPMLDLSAGNVDFDVTVGACAITVARLSPSPSLVGCSAAPFAYCERANNCGPISTTMVCDGTGGMQKPICCPGAQICNGDHTCQ